MKVNGIVLTNSDNENIYPVTSTKSVKMDNGTTLDEKLSTTILTGPETKEFYINSIDNRTGSLAVEIKKSKKSKKRLKDKLDKMDDDITLSNKVFTSDNVIMEDGCLLTDEIKTVNKIINKTESIVFDASNILNEGKDILKENDYSGYISWKSQPELNSKSISESINVINKIIGEIKSIEIINFSIFNIYSNTCSIRYALNKIIGIEGNHSIIVGPPSGKRNYYNIGTNNINDEGLFEYSINNLVPGKSYEGKILIHFLYNGVDIKIEKSFSFETPVKNSIVNIDELYVSNTTLTSSEINYRITDNDKELIHEISLNQESYIKIEPEIVNGIYKYILPDNSLKSDIVNEVSIKISYLEEGVKFFNIHSMYLQTKRLEILDIRSEILNPSTVKIIYTPNYTNASIKHILYCQKTKESIEVEPVKEENGYSITLNGLDTDTEFNYEIRLEIEDYSTSKGIIFKTEKVTIWGFRWNKKDSDPDSCIEYIEDCENMIPMNFKRENGRISYNSWVDHPILNFVKPCVLNLDGNVETYIDPHDYSKTIMGETVNSSKNIMIEFKKLYYSLTESGDIIEFKISDKKVNDTFISYAFTDSNNITKDYFYVASYSGYGSKLSSRSNVIPSTFISNTKIIKEYAKSNGPGWNIMNIHIYNYLMLLHILVTKSLNVQSKLGQGYLFNSKNRIKTGACDKEGLFSGSDGSTIKTFGIENLWGGECLKIDGLSLNSGEYIISKGNECINTGIIINSECNICDYIREFKVYDNTLLPYINRGASSTTFSTDQCYLPYNYIRDCEMGNTSQDIPGGIFNFNFSTLSDSTYVNKTSRLIFI